MICQEYLHDNKLGHVHGLNWEKLEGLCKSTTAESRRDHSSHRGADHEVDVTPWITSPKDDQMESTHGPMIITDFTAHIYIRDVQRME